MAEVGIFVGTMYGNSLLVAEEAEAILSGLGHKATVFEDPEVKDWESYTGKYVLVVLMFVGRTGTMTLGAALALRSRRRVIRMPEERPIIG